MSWHLPDGRGGFRARPFTYTTPASAFLIEVLAEEDAATWRDIERVAIYDPDARSVAAGFIAAGHGDDLVWPSLAASLR